MCRRPSVSQSRGFAARTSNGGRLSSGDTSSWGVHASLGQCAGLAGEPVREGGDGGHNDVGGAGVRNETLAPWVGEEGPTEKMAGREGLVGAPPFPILETRS